MPDFTSLLFGAVMGMLMTAEGQIDNVLSLSFSPDGQMIASGCGNGTLRLWQGSNGVLLANFKNYGSSIFCLAFSPDGKTLASGHGTELEGSSTRLGDNSVRLWQLSTRQVVETLKGSHWGVACLAYSPSSLFSTRKQGYNQFIGILRKKPALNTYSMPQTCTF